MRVQPVMRSYFFAWLLMSSTIAFSQAGPPDKTATSNRRSLLLKANDVIAAGTQRQSPSFQAANWKAEAEQNPADASAWLNYYLWTSREKNLFPVEKESRLAEIFSQAEKQGRQSAEYFLLKYLQSGKKDSGSLNKAFDLSNDKTTLCQYKIQHAIIII